MTTREQVGSAAAALLVRAGAAHGVYEERELGGVYDQEWPAWYAAYLIDHGFGDLVGRSITVGQVAEWLKGCDAAHKAERSREPWPAFYASRLDALAGP